MDTQKAWSQMNDDTKKLVLTLYQKYYRSNDKDALREIRDIFKNHDCDSPAERELERILRK